jgi:WD40 repeat protein
MFSRIALALTVACLALMACLQVRGALLGERPSTFPANVYFTFVQEAWASTRFHLRAVGLKGHRRPVSRVIASADCRTLASVSNEERAIKLWDVTTRAELATLEGFEGDPWTLALSPDGRVLATALRAAENAPPLTTITLWDVSTGERRATLAGHTDDIYSVAFSPDGETLASGSKDKTVKLWSVSAGKVRATLIGLPGPACWVAFSPDGKTLAASGGGMTRLWDVDTRKERATWVTRYNTFTFSPDGKALASTRLWDPVPTLWDSASGNEQPLEQPRWHQDVEEPSGGNVLFSPDGRNVLAGCEQNLDFYDVATGKHRGTLHFRPWLESLYVARVLLTPEGKLVALGIEGSTVWMWDIATFRR